MSVGSQLVSSLENKCPLFEISVFEADSVMIAKVAAVDPVFLLAIPRQQS